MNVTADVATPRSFQSTEFWTANVIIGIVMPRPAPSITMASDT